MANQYPDNVPTGFAGDRTDFLKVKRATDGALRSEYKSISVADSASAGTTYGLVPFQKGYRVSYGSALTTTDLDTATNVTLNVGYLYESTALTSDADAFASALSGQAAALLAFDEEAGVSWVAEGDGWITVALAAGPVTTAGTITGKIDGCYDGLDAAN